MSWGVLPGSGPAGGRRLPIRFSRHTHELGSSPPACACVAFPRAADRLGEQRTKANHRGAGVLPGPNSTQPQQATTNSISTPSRWCVAAHKPMACCSPAWSINRLYATRGREDAAGGLIYAPSSALVRKKCLSLLVVSCALASGLAGATLYLPTKHGWGVLPGRMHCKDWGRVAGE